MALTDLQKNVAVRVVVGQKVTAIMKEFRISEEVISGWMRNKEFEDYMRDVADNNRLKVMQYLESKQFGCIDRLFELMKNRKDLKVAHRSAVDLLGFSGLENKNVAPVIKTDTIHVGRTEEEIDEDLEEVQSLLDGNE